jgi:hypothetical protein
LELEATGERAGRTVEAQGALVTTEVNIIEHDPENWNLSHHRRCPCMGAPLLGLLHFLAALQVASRAAPW